MNRSTRVRPATVCVQKQCTKMSTRVVTLSKH